MKEFRDTGYFVTKNGEIIGKLKTLKPSITPSGYASVCLYFNGKYKTFLIHRMVAECYIPNPDNKPQINHKNGDKLNNDYTNLEWSTSEENINHAINILGYRTLGDCPNSKLSINDMFEIYRCHINDGIYQTHLAKKYNVDTSTISRAIKNIKKQMKN